MKKLKDCGALCLDLMGLLCGDNCYSWEIPMVSEAGGFQNDLCTNFPLFRSSSKSQCAPRTQEAACSLVPGASTAATGMKTTKQNQHRPQLNLIGPKPKLTGLRRSLSKAHKPHAQKLCYGPQVSVVPLCPSPVYTRDS